VLKNECGINQSIEESSSSSSSQLSATSKNPRHVPVRANFINQ
jgi:hypothetical protein